MYKKPTKGKEVRRLILIYSLMTLTVGLLVAVLVFIMLGYRFNGEQHRIIQTGLVQFNSTPEDAIVEIDRKRLSNRTPTKSVVAPGVHEFAMWQQGYETWWKELSINAGTITWLDYARLVPKDRPVEVVREFESLADLSFSPQGQFAIAHPNVMLPSWQLLDLRNPDDITQSTLAIPKTILSGYPDPDEDEAADDQAAAEEEVDHAYNVKEWDQSGRYLLVKHTYDKMSEWLLVDRENVEQTKNISEIVNLPIHSAQISGTNGNEVYVLTGGAVRLVNLSSGSLSRAFASNVQKFSVYGTDVITYVGTKGTNSSERVVGIVRKDDKKPTVLKTVQVGNDTPINVTTARYYRQNYVVISVGSSVEIYSGDYPSGEESLKGEIDSLMRPLAVFDFTRPITWLQMSGNGRFIIAQDAKGYVAYDLERKDLSDEITFQEPVTRKLNWIDNYNLWNEEDGQLVMREFDGANSHELLPASAQFGASLDDDEEYLYAADVTEDGATLQRIRMILPQ